MDKLHFLHQLCNISNDDVDANTTNFDKCMRYSDVIDQCYSALRQIENNYGAQDAFEVLPMDFNALDSSDTKMTIITKPRKFIGVPSSVILEKERCVLERESYTDAYRLSVSM
jgi:hypothetical protein